AVEVVGTPPPEAAQVRQVLARFGVRPGAWKGQIDPGRVEDGLLRVLPDLAWAEVQVVGSVARVEVRPRRDEQRRDLAPGDVVAAVDGLVTQVIPAAGWPVVQPGDVVRRGQVLISGRPPLSAPPDARPVRAAGVVYARIWAEGFAETGLEMRLDRPSGRLAWGILVTAGPWQMRLGAVEPPFRRFRTEVIHRRPPGPLTVLPLSWDRIVHEELESQVFPLDVQGARRIAEERALEQAASALGLSPDVLERRVNTWEEETGGGQRLIRSRAVIEAVQNIATFLPYPEPSPSPAPPSPSP
ncbi:MAG: sporulation protein YqfD, partial [Bacillota bacterium]